MTSIFIVVYHFFRKRRWLLFFLMVASFVAFAYYGAQLSYEENIAKLLPKTDNTKAEGLAFSELKVRDKLFILLQSKSGETDAGMLAEASRTFVDSLLVLDASDDDVGDVLYQIDEELKQQVISYALDHLPVMLDPSIYPIIDSLTTRERVFQQMKINLEKMSSPEGFVFLRIMRYDPLNLRSALLTGFDGDIAKMMGGNFVLYDNQLFSSDTTVALIFVSPNFISFDSKACIRLVDKIQIAIKQLEISYPDVEVLLHGPPVQSVFNSRQIRQDLVFTLGISLLLSCLLIMVCFRNKSTLPMLLLPIVYGAFLALACMFWLQDTMSLMALGIGAVVLGVALSYCLHVITHFKYLTDPERVLKDQVRPVLFGGITTIGAFMGLLFTDSAILRDFGWFISFAMAGTTMACLLFLPQLFTLIKNYRSEKAFAVLEKINSYPLERQYWLLIVIVGAFVAGLFFQSKVKFDTNLRHIGYFDPIVTRSMDLYAEKTSTGYTTSYYAATSGDLDSAIMTNRIVSEVCDSLQTAGLIAHYTKSATFLLPQAEQEKRIATWKAYWNGERVDELKKNVITAGEANKFRPALFDPFFEMITKDYSPSSLYDSSVLPKGIMANLIENSQGMYLIYTAVQLNPEHLKAVNDHLASQPRVIVCDPFYYTTNMVELMNRDFNTILWISSLFVLFCLIITLRSLPVALIAFLPMSMSWYIVLGVMAMLGLQFNLINIIISTFIFGIGVDYSIFIMEGLLSDVKKYDAKLLMYHKTAIFLSAVVLIISIASLIFAKHPALKSIGTATLIGMTSTILTAYALLPFLFKLLMKTPYRRVLQKRYNKSLSRI